MSFETAQQAIEKGETRLALRLLHELAAVAESEPERLLYRAVGAAAGGQDDEHRELVEAALSRLGDGAGDSAARVAPWIESELLTLGAALRLEELEAESARRLEEVLAAHHRALGGLERELELRSFVAVGRLLVGDQTLPFRLVRARPGLYRFDLSTRSGPWVEVAEPQAAWRSDPSVDGGRPSYLSGEQSDRLKRSARFHGPLVSTLAGERLFYRGVDEHDGREGQLIEVTQEGRLRETILLDGETHLATRRRFFDRNGEMTAEITTEFGDVDGRKLPRRQTVRGATGTLVYHFDTYRLDVDLDLALFDIANARSAAPTLDPALR